MTANTINRESARETRWNIFMAVVLAAAGFFMTFYSAATITGLIVRWLGRPY
ncbi:MAG: hypothetical protein ACXW28_09785 [Thermoanaerobaculia bacterium]